MIAYLNRGFIAKQAICALTREYFETLRLDEKYKNFHISITTEHPFAELYMRDGMNASDSFPCIVVTSQQDGKPAEFNDLEPSLRAIGVTAEDLERITTTKESYVTAAGERKEREKAGLCTIVDESALAELREELAGREYVYGYSIGMRRKETIGIEIWAENDQLKEELYEQARLFVAGNLQFLLTRKYPTFEIVVFDNTITGHRANNYNFDFDVVLTGAHISFDMNYCVEQIVINTDVERLSNEIITEVINHVKTDKKDAS